MKKYFLYLLILLFQPYCKSKGKAEDYNPNKLHGTITDITTYPLPFVPLISAHRGGRYIEGFPENCLETFQYITSKYDFIIEMDIVMSSDSVLYLMHDRSLERTTNGYGSSFNQSWDYISGLYLKDSKGLLTTYKVPTLETVLQWADGNALLSLDIKRGTDRKLLLKLLYQFEAYRFAEIITYSAEEVTFYKEHAPEFILSANVRNEDEINRVLATGINKDRIKPFLGTSRKSHTFIQTLHDIGWVTTLGTLGNIDAQAQARGFRIYDELIEMGVDIFATDYPLEVAQYYYNTHGNQ
ncbi:MAG TPA: glycerophosphodiester phosphodiesterase family protein [Saprospiraceae bacterium]|nr:glycerophosphodiester phosphodiesterase family protein [Saprospiraceae bacterium]